MKKLVIPKIIYYLLISIIFLLTIATIASSNKFKTPYKLFSVQSGSMKPTLNIGDLIITKEQNDYNPQDIVTFDGGVDNNKKIIITHRIVEEKTKSNVEYYTTKGDYNSVNDIDEISKEIIIGKYLFKIPLVGYLITFARTVPGFIILLVIPSTIIIYEEVKKIKYAWKTRNPEKIE